mgnify:CR=1 FL=1
MKKIIKYEKLKKFIEEVFIKAWASLEDAKIVTDVLIESDLRWIKSHWINRMQRYLTDIENHLNSKPQDKDLYLQKHTDSSQRVIWCTTKYYCRFF